MSEEKNSQRRKQIETAAFEVLSQKGFRSTSMLQIAKQAQASNQTLYAWYGNKQNLFKTIIRNNGQVVRSLLQEALHDQNPPLETFENLGIFLLRFTTSDKAIIMNRAAITDANETGVLASAITEIARGSLYPLICSFMKRLEETGYYKFENGGDDAAETYVSLLFGEVPMRQAFGAIGPLKDQEINKRATRAIRLFNRLYGTERLSE